MIEITRKDEALKLIKEKKLQLADCNERHQKDRDVVLTAVKNDGNEIQYALLSEMENNTEVNAQNTFLFEAIKVANLTIPQAVQTFREVIDVYVREVDGYIKNTFKKLTPSERKTMIKTYQNQFYTELAIAYAKQKSKAVIKSAIETESKKKARKVAKPEHEITRKDEAIKLLKGGMLKLKDCADRHRRDEEVVLTAVKVDGAEIDDAYLAEMENDTEINAKNTFLIKVIPYAKLDTKNAVAIFDSTIKFYTQSKDRYIRKNFKKLKDGDRRRMVRTYESELETELAVSYAKQKPLAVIESASTSDGKTRAKKKSVEIYDVAEVVEKAHTSEEITKLQ